MQRPLAFLLASRLTSYPDPENISVAQQIFSEAHLPQQASLNGFSTWAPLHQSLEQQLALEDFSQRMQSDYIDIFDRGRDVNPAYETEYGRARALAKGNELADLSGFYTAFGLNLTDDPKKRDMLDHVSVELEFYAWLAMKLEYLEQAGDTTGAEITRKAQCSFLSDHLGRFVDAMALRPGIANHPFYSLAYNWCRDLVREECMRLDVKPLETGFIAPATREDTAQCGATETLSPHGP